MKYPWIDEYLTAKRGATKDLQPDWNWIRYHIGGKMFAAVLLDDDDRPYYINLKLEPVEGALMRGQFPDIIPGYYSNKEHWNSVKADGDVPDDLLKTLLDRSYRLVLGKLSRPKRREALSCETGCAGCPLADNCKERRSAS
ncbi:MAG: MmcQ/YjbR family DNA-binding protein [Clostridia bacterium]|nr:MmcQ/YjbR family DNA-binding protein [Clostridia bacterium]